MSAKLAMFSITSCVGEIFGIYRASGKKTRYSGGAIALSSFIVPFLSYVAPSLRRLRCGILPTCSTESTLRSYGKHPYSIFA